MPDEPTEADRSFVGKTTSKDISSKKELTRDKNLLAAKKKDFVSDNVAPPVELMMFLNSYELYEHKQDWYTIYNRTTFRKYRQ